MLDGKRIREIRLKLGFTARDIEKISHNGKFKTSISKSYLEELERGTKKNPSLKKIEVISDILGCTLEEIIVRR